MQWKINKTIDSKIHDVLAYVQSQSIKKTQISKWIRNRPDVFEDGRKIYGHRLETDFADNKFTLKISNARYNDSGNYIVQTIQLDPVEQEVDVATVNVHGMFFFQLLSVINILKGS